MLFKIILFKITCLIPKYCRTASSFFYTGRNLYRHPEYIRHNLLQHCIFPDSITRCDYSTDMSTRHRLIHSLQFLCDPVQYPGRKCFRRQIVFTDPGNFSADRRIGSGAAEGCFYRQNTSAFDAFRRQGVQNLIWDS